MALFDEEHRKMQEENGRKLRERLRMTVAKGRQPGLMGAIDFNFSRSLLNDLETRTVVKETRRTKRNP